MRRASARAVIPLGTSLLLHGALAVAAFLVATRPRPVPQAPLQIQVIEAPPPARPAEPAPAPVPMKVARAPKMARRALPPPTPTPLPPSEAPPPPTEEAPKNTPDPVVITGITMESTSQGGSFAVGVGNTM